MFRTLDPSAHINGGNAATIGLYSMTIYITNAVPGGRRLVPLGAEGDKLRL
jgi:hypothetical protein